MFLQTVSKIESEQADVIRIRLHNVSEPDVFKLKKIFQLSSTRKRQYEYVEGDADLIISSEPNYISNTETPIITLGDPKLFQTSKYHLKLPLTGIRVLRVLDSISVNTTDASVNSESTPSENIEPVQQLQNHYKILVVDDSVLIHKALQLELEKAEFQTEIEYAESGEQCLDLINENHYDLVFLDVMMPGIDGYETCSEIRKIPKFKKTPVIMLSAKTSPLDEVKGVMAGCTTYLTKPIQHEEFQKLLTRMDNWLENFNPTQPTNNQPKGELA